MGAGSCLCADADHWCRSRSAKVVRLRLTAHLRSSSSPWTFCIEMFFFCGGGASNLVSIVRFQQCAHSYAQRWPTALRALTLLPQRCFCWVKHKCLHTALSALTALPVYCRAVTWYTGCTDCKTLYSAIKLGYRLTTVHVTVTASLKYPVCFADNVTVKWQNATAVLNALAFCHFVIVLSLLCIHTPLYESICCCCQLEWLVTSDGSMCWLCRSGEWFIGGAPDAWQAADSLYVPRGYWQESYWLQRRCWWRCWIWVDTAGARAERATFTWTTLYWQRQPTHLHPHAAH